MKKLVSTAGLDKKEWLLYRKQGIGGSDAGAICGLNSYRTAMQVYLDKTSEEVEEIDNEAMLQGRDFEDYVARRFMKATGKKVRRANAMYYDEKEKVGNEYLMYRRFLKAALSSAEEFVKIQMSWIKMMPEELQIVKSTYRVERETELRRKLLSVKNMTKEAMQTMKEELANEFFDLIGDIIMKKQSFSKVKLIAVCERFNLRVDEKTANGKKFYSIVEDIVER